MLAYVNFGSTKILVNLLYKIHNPTFTGNYVAQILRSKVCSNYGKNKFAVVGSLKTLDNVQVLKGNPKNIEGRTFPNNFAWGTFIDTINGSETQS